MKEPGSKQPAQLTVRMILMRYLRIALLAFSLVIITKPLIPGIVKQVSITFDPTAGYVYHSKLAEHAGLDLKTAPLKPPPKKNTLLIPKIGVDAEILEGENESILNNGVWRRPKTGDPEQGGNIVLAAHRYAKLTGPNTFYLLNKMEKGDVFSIFWNGKEYSYMVFATKIVPPTDDTIERNTISSMVTLYTCTPLWTGTSRLVVLAYPVDLH